MPAPSLRGGHISDPFNHLPFGFGDWFGPQPYNQQNFEQALTVPAAFPTPGLRRLVQQQQPVPSLKQPPTYWTNPPPQQPQFLQPQAENSQQSTTDIWADWLFYSIRQGPLGGIAFDVTRLNEATILAKSHMPLVARLVEYGRAMVAMIWNGSRGYPSSHMVEEMEKAG